MGSSRPRRILRERLRLPERLSDYPGSDEHYEPAAQQLPETTASYPLS
jgi:hypothetical protein